MTAEGETTRETITSEELLVLEEIAKIGSWTIDADWNAIRTLCVRRLKEVLDGMNNEEDPRYLNYENDVEYVFNCFQTFVEAPFTLQRMTELLLKPTVYSSKQRFLFAFRKLVANITTGVPENIFDELVEKGFQSYEEVIANRKKQLVDQTDLPFGSSGGVENSSSAMFIEETEIASPNRPSPMEIDNPSEENESDSSSDDEPPPPPPGAMEVESVSSDIIHSHE